MLNDAQPPQVVGKKEAGTALGTQLLVASEISKKCPVRLGAAALCDDAYRSVSVSELLAVHAEHISSENILIIAGNSLIKV